MRILVVEDNEPIADAVVHGLRQSGHAVDRVADGRSADEMLRGGSFDLVVLDLGLPQLDGLAVLQRARERGDRTPVVILTARDDVGDRVRGLDAGADDYIFKPFEMVELEARIRAVSRRAIARSGGEIEAGCLRLRTGERRFFVRGEPLDLSRREFDLLETLLLHRSRVISKQNIQERLCEWDEELSDTAIELYIHRVRRKLADARADVTIRTIRGFGYLLQAADGDG
ncbi:MAG: response regulator [Panacagrimonas sp.]